MHVKMVTNPAPWSMALHAAVDKRIRDGAYFELPLAWERASGWPVDARFYLTNSSTIFVLLDNWETGGAEAVDRLLRILR